MIQEAWNAEKASVVSMLRNKDAVMLAGDARCDSPGQCAKYGSYTLMDADGSGEKGSRKIVDVQLVQVTEVKNFNHMEPEGMRRGLKQVMDVDKLPVKMLATADI